ncbi:hypothetical protein HF086_013027 [Spodoptera exigua]|uniref:Vesicle transport protein USE1 n=1 Tax=Spodoptera exigua TaxID=7107 RepID=A0A922MPN1_SPOEX|nr:hypothetical protein HF086_013027 [Spodoptera exigua]
MAVEGPERPKPLPVAKKSRMEMNVRLLLNKCELMAKQEPIDNNCRLEQYVETLTEMIAELKTSKDKPPKEQLAEYIKRASFLKGVVQTASLNTPSEKVCIIFP